MFATLLILLGLTAPSHTPKLFAPGVISTDAYEFAVSMTPAMDEIYFTRREGDGQNRIFVAPIVDGEVETPVRVAFAQPGGEFEPCVAPDGQRIYFGRDMQIVYCTRDGEGWSSPTALPEQINATFAMAICADTDGNLYFTRRGELVVAKPSGDGYTEAGSLGPHFERSAGGSAHGFVAPDASYIVFDSQGRSDGHGRADLYVSFRTADGNWSEPRNIDVLNTPGTDMCPSVSPDGKTLYFCRDGDIYRVDSAVIEQYR